MQTFEIRVTETIEKVIEVEADNLDQALAIADEMAASGEIDLSKNFDGYDLCVELA